MGLMKIDSVTFPQTSGVTVQTAFENVVNTLRDTQVLLMHVNNACRELEAKVQQLEARSR